MSIKPSHLSYRSLRTPCALLNTASLVVLAVLVLASIVARNLTPRSRLAALAWNLSPPLSRSRGTRPLSTTIPTTKMTYEKELHIASLAVQRAAILTKAVFRAKVKGTLSKDDKSPVTIGDYGAQALIIAAIKHAFPADEVVGEEEAASLREQKDLAAQIWALVKDVQLSDVASD